MPLLALCFAAVLLCLTSASAAVTPIGDLVNNPDAYANQNVTIEGTVTARVIKYLSETAYTLRGSDGYRVTVFGRDSAPMAGSKLVVTGLVAHKTPDEVHDFPPVIQETTRETQAREAQ